MNEQIKQQKAAEFRNMVVELHERAKELENAGLNVVLKVQRFNIDVTAPSHSLMCEIFERKAY